MAFLSSKAFFEVMARPPAAFAALWQPAQFCSRIGATSFLKSLCEYAAVERRTRNVALDKFRNPGLGERPHFETPVPIELLGEKLFLRVERLLPGHLLTRVGGHTAHHRQQRTGGHALPVIHRLVPADRREEQIVLALVHVVLSPVEGPVGLALDARLGTASDGARA